MNNKVVLVIGALLIAVGLFRPDFSFLLNRGDTNPVLSPIVNVEEPKDEKLKELAMAVSNVLKDGTSDRKVDGLALASLWKDLAALIMMDKENEVLRTTAELREANAVSGKLMDLNLKGKYDGLPEAARAVVVYAIGDNNVVLTEEMRAKAAEAFEALSWAAYQGAK